MLPRRKILPTKEQIAENELQNFRTDASPNPFKGVTPAAKQNFLTRLKQTYHVFAGVRSGNEVPFWKIRQKGDYGKQGIFNYILGMPSHLLYSVVPGLGLAVVEIGEKIQSFSKMLLENAKKANNPRLSTILSSPLRGLLSLVGYGLKKAGYLEYGLTKAALHVVNWLVQKVATPIISIAATIVVSPIVGLVHLIQGHKRKRNNTGSNQEYGDEFQGTNAYVSSQTKTKTKTQGQGQTQTQTYGNSSTYSAQPKQDVTSSTHTPYVQLEEDGSPYYSQVQYEEYDDAPTSSQPMTMMGSHHQQQRLQHSTHNSSSPLLNPSTATNVYGNQYNGSSMYNPVVTNLRNQATQTKQQQPAPTVTSTYAHK